MDTFLKIYFSILSFFMINKDTDTRQYLFSPIEGISNVQQGIWVNEKEIVFVKDSKILLFNIENKEKKYLAERKGNEFVGIGRDGLLLCSIEHYEIQSMNEFSTIFKIYNKQRDNTKELKFFETIRPIYMNDELIIAVTALDFLEEHFYKINIENGKYEEIEIERKKYNVKIPKGFQMKKAFIRNQNKYIVEDLFGNLYIYKGN